MNEQEFGDISEANRFVENEGHIGLGQKNNYTTFSRTLAEQLDKPQFTIALKRNTLFKSNAEVGDIAFGSDKIYYCDNNVNLFDTQENGDWQIQVDNLYVNDKNINNSQLVTPIYELDLLYLPKNYYDQVVNTTGVKSMGKYNHFIDCDLIETLPVFTFKVNGEKYTLEGADYIKKVNYQNFS